MASVAPTVNRLRTWRWMLLILNILALPSLVLFILDLYTIYYCGAALSQGACSLEQSAPAFAAIILPILIPVSNALSGSGQFILFSLLPLIALIIDFVLLSGFAIRRFATRKSPHRPAFFAPLPRQYTRVMFLLAVGVLSVVLVIAYLHN